MMTLPNAPVFHSQRSIYPDFFTSGSDPKKHPVNDCIRDVVFPDELNEFIRGNLLIGNTMHDCDSCQGFYGSYDWKSRCDETGNYSGRWSTVDLGATVVFDPTSEVQTPLHFNTLNSSSGHWKLSYGTGEASVTIYYKAIRN